MNNAQKTRFRAYVSNNRAILLGQLLKPGIGRTVAEKEGNYEELQEILLKQIQANNTEADVREAAAIFKEVTNRDLEVQKPPSDNGAARNLATLNRDSTQVRLMHNGVDARLDIDQNKHQDSSQPIGTRIVGGGSKFVATCGDAWHRANTLLYMANWAAGLGPMSQGQKQFHGQGIPVNDIHYEGFCLMADGQKYVLFHCYPANASSLKQK